jgi:hypothetical protein
MTAERVDMLKTVLGEDGYRLTVYRLDEGQVTLCEAAGARWWIYEWVTEPDA